MSSYTKRLNEKHNVILNIALEAESKYDEGKPCIHNQHVQNIHFFNPCGYGKYNMVVLSKDMILDLAQQIKEIQSSQIVKPYESEPPF